MYLCRLVRGTSVDFEVKSYEDRPRGTPPLGVLNRRGKAKYRDFGPLQDYYISRKRCKIGGKLLLMTNRQSHMSFRLVPNSVTLDDLERRNSANRCVISPN